MADSFWVIPDTAQLRTPLSILREQAAALTARTKGVLVGEVSAKPEGDRLVVLLDVIVPGLNDYRYRVLNYRQPLEMYPGDLRVGGGEAQIIHDEEAFVNAIKAALSSDKIRNVLTSLLAQASDA